MMRKLLIAGLLALLTACVGAPPVHAQSNNPVLLPLGCGTGSFGTSSIPYLTLDSSGRLCGNYATAANVTPADCSGTITSGGTAQNAFTAQTNLKGFTIANLDTSEVMWISFTGAATANTPGSYPLAPATATTFAGLSSYTTPAGFGMNTALSVLAATTSHKWSCTRW